jgi:hypothetical protein
VYTEAGAAKAQASGKQLFVSNLAPDTTWVQLKVVLTTTIASITFVILLSYAVKAHSLTMLKIALLTAISTVLVLVNCV